MEGEPDYPERHFPAWSIEEATATLARLRGVTEVVNQRAASLSWVVWFLMLSSFLATGTILDRVLGRPSSAANIAIYAVIIGVYFTAWLAAGGAAQLAIWRAFSIAGPADEPLWKTPLLALRDGWFMLLVAVPVGAVASLVPLLAWEWAGGAGDRPLGLNDVLAGTLRLGGIVALVVAISLHRLGIPRSAGVAVGLAAVAASAVVDLHWLPEFGEAGFLVGLALLAPVYLGLAAHLWRRG